MKDLAATGSGTAVGEVGSGWYIVGKTLGVALDLDAGTLLVSVEGGKWDVAFQDGCSPGSSVGAALFPALSGRTGARLRLNWGADARRPMRHSPPSGDYRAVGLPPLQVHFSTFFLTSQPSILSTPMPHSMLHSIPMPYIDAPVSARGWRLHTSWGGRLSRAGRALAWPHKWPHNARYAPTLIHTTQYTA